jgi:hypothetical protein
VLGQLVDGPDAKRLPKGRRLAAGQPQRLQRRRRQLVEVHLLVRLGTCSGSPILTSCWQPQRGRYRGGW